MIFCALISDTTSPLQATVGIPGTGLTGDADKLCPRWIIKYIKEIIIALVVFIFIATIFSILSPVLAALL